MNIEKIRVEDLSLDPVNARKHPERNLEAIKASLRRFGQQKPIVIDASNVVRAGNGTLEAAKALGWETLDCVRTELTGSEATAYAIADNRTAELAEWNHDVLCKTLISLEEECPGLAGEFSFDLALMSGSSTLALPEKTLENADTVSLHDETYDSSVVRQIVLIFSSEEYAAVIDAFKAYSEQNELSNNTEVVKHLLKRYGYEVP